MLQPRTNTSASVSGNNKSKIRKESGPQSSIHCDLKPETIPDVDVVPITTARNEPYQINMIKHSEGKHSATLSKCQHHLQADSPRNTVPKLNIINPPDFILASQGITGSPQGNYKHIISLSNQELDTGRHDEISSLPEM